MLLRVLSGTAVEIAFPPADDDLRYEFRTKLGPCGGVFWKSSTYWKFVVRVPSLSAYRDDERKSFSTTSESRRQTVWAILKYLYEKQT